MKKTALTTPARSKTIRKRSAGYPQLVTAISAINTQMVTRVATVANQALVLRNWMAGAYTVEFDQNGADRAKYGERLAQDLKGKGMKAAWTRTLWNCKALYFAYPQIRQSALTGFGGAASEAETLQTVRAESGWHLKSHLRLIPTFLISRVWWTGLSIQKRSWSRLAGSRAALPRTRSR